MVKILENISPTTWMVSVEKYRRRKIFPHSYFSRISSKRISSRRMAYIILFCYTFQWLQVHIQNRIFYYRLYADLTLFYTYTCDLLKNHINELHKLKCKQETIISRILFFKNFLATYDYSCHILAVNKFIENTYLSRVGRNLQKLVEVSHFLLRSSYA